MNENDSSRGYLYFGVDESGGFQKEGYFVLACAISQEKPRINGYRFDKKRGKLIDTTSFPDFHFLVTDSSFFQQIESLGLTPTSRMCLQFDFRCLQIADLLDKSDIGGQSIAYIDNFARPEDIVVRTKFYLKKLRGKNGVKILAEKDATTRIQLVNEADQIANYVFRSINGNRSLEHIDFEFPEKRITTPYDLFLELYQQYNQIRR